MWPQTRREHGSVAPRERTQLSGGHAEAAETRCTCAAGKQRRALGKDAGGDAGRATDCRGGPRARGMKGNQVERLGCLHQATAAKTARANTATAARLICLICVICALRACCCCCHYCCPCRRSRTSSLCALPATRTRRAKSPERRRRASGLALLPAARRLCLPPPVRLHAPFRASSASCSARIVRLHCRSSLHPLRQTASRFTELHPPRKASDGGMFP